MSTNKIILNDSLIEIQKMKKESIDLIIIDPPYNEGKSKGSYQDKWKGKSSKFPFLSDLNGKYIDFLDERISLSKEVLKDQGLLFLFIGDKEVHYVRILLDSIFNSDNYVGTLVWDSSSNQQKTKVIDRNHEYVLVYAKNIKEFSKLGLYKNEELSQESLLYTLAQQLKLNKNSYDENQEEYLESYKEALKEDKTILKFKYISPDYIPFYCDNSGDPRNGSKKKLTHPITGKECPLPGNGKGWRFSDDYLNQIEKSKNIHLLPDDRVLVYEPHPKKTDLLGMVFGKDESGVPSSARAYSSKTEKKIMTTTGYSFKGNKKEGIDQSSKFETVKPIEFIKEIILNYPKKDIIILDFFAGSGSTGVGAELANRADNGKRSFVLIEENKNIFDNVLIPKLKHFKVNFKK